MKASLALCGLVVALSACGDNSNKCDPGTTRNENGVCIGNLTCSDGTVLVDGKCEIDPNSCQGGTVLVGGKCVDPGVTTADIEEGAEPNGAGVIEQSIDPAGTINLKAEGEHFVIHGKIVPFRDQDADGQDDPDIDTYVVTVTAPTMLNVTADGTNGLAGAFLSVANVAANNPLSDWQRFGINLSGDTSKRQLYLPVAGTYLIAVGDSRSLFLAGGAAGAAEGKPAFEYYVTVDRITATPTALTFTNGVATSTGMRQPGEVKLFTAALGEGLNNATLGSNTPQLQASVAIVNTHNAVNRFVGVGNADNSTGDPASIGAIGIRTGDTTIIVADSVFDYANSPTDYSLSVTSGSAGALPTNNMPVSQPATATDFSVFYYDVVPDGLLVGMNVAFDKPVAGVVVDENFFIFSLFTYDPADGFFYEDTFSSYKGLLKHATPGRYYFLTFDPTLTPTSPAATLTATSTYGSVTATPIIKGTPLNGTAVNAFESNAFLYTPAIATDPWQSFTGAGVSTGTITAAFFKTAAVGRLDTLTNTCGSFCEDRPVPVFSQTYLAAGQTRGRILLDNAAEMQFLITINTATVAGTPTFDLSFATQANVNDLGTAAVGVAQTANDKPLNATTATLQRYLVRSAAGNGLAITVTPDDVGTNTRIQRVNVDETANGALVNNGGAGAADSTIAVQSAAGWTAFTVDKTGTDGTVDTSVLATAPVTYTTAAGATAFSDACTGGTAVTLSDLDEGLSAAINTPTGFDYFGFAAPQLKVFANGFVSFDTTTTCGGTCFFSNADMPGAAAPNAIAAPYWDDIVLTGACQKTSGTKLIIQWTGTLYMVTPTQTVSMQLIIDGSNDKLEFVYGPTHTATGSGATVGIENQLGTTAKKLSFNAATAAAPTLFTPM